MLPGFELCCSAFEKYGIILDEIKYKKLNKYAEFLVEYNLNVNLTALTEPQDILYKHFIDSIMLTKYVDIPENSAIIDVGTGAGFPSVPLKIFRDDIKLTLLDSLAKRISFLEKLCDLLEIEAEAVHGRAEDIAKIPEYREKFDFSCARAVANLSTLSEYCIPFVKKNGSFISMKGPNEDVKSAENAIKILGGEIASNIEYEVESDKRRIITIKKNIADSAKIPQK